MLFYFHPGDLGLPFILFLLILFFIIPTIATLVYAFYNESPTPKNNTLELTAFNKEKDENSTAPQD